MSPSRPQLDIAGRGDHAYITTFPGEPLDHAYDLNTTDICPVGALTAKHFRFQQRVWLLKSVESIDPSDALGANLTIEYNDGRVWRLMPRRNPEVNKSWIANSRACSTRIWRATASPTACSTAPTPPSRAHRHPPSLR
jgi:NADH-quinone oxidoreductase subunit G